MARTLGRAAQDATREARMRTRRSKGLRYQRATPQRARGSAAGAHAAKTGTVPRAVRHTPRQTPRRHLGGARAQLAEERRYKAALARCPRGMHAPTATRGGGRRPAQRVRRPGAPAPPTPADAAPRPAAESGAAPTASALSAGSRGPYTPQRGRRPAQARARAAAASPRSNSGGRQSARSSGPLRPAHGARRRAPPPLKHGMCCARRPPLERARTRMGSREAGKP